MGQLSSRSVKGENYEGQQNCTMKHSFTVLIKVNALIQYSNSNDGMLAVQRFLYKQGIICAYCSFMFCDGNSEKCKKHDHRRSKILVMLKMHGKRSQNASARSLKLSFFFRLQPITLYLLNRRNRGIWVGSRKRCKDKYSALWQLCYNIRSKPT